MEEIKQDFERFLRHEAMYRNVIQDEVFKVIINVLKDYDTTGIM